LTLSYIQGNSALSDGGGVYLLSCNGTLSEVNLTANYAVFLGGGLFLDDSNINIKNSIIILT
jgi:hypothetical protein